ncbi:hypothetical protein E4U57_007677 [Claviceps arundinis]|uniref:Uncharacterized protein n=1 Tax=Claviceps arundinis TaxID=1623583 RepID=A0A9P7MXG3_9HYPO|nr:hypothetical protein E4U57_007677 [Claviceps arundinis]KAG5975566.1 hypothetical protein E4U56_003509 [Claviceps arundinis]
MPVVLDFNLPKTVGTDGVWVKGLLPNGLTRKGSPEHWHMLIPRHGPLTLGGRTIERTKRTKRTPRRFESGGCRAALDFTRTIVREKRNWTEQWKTEYSFFFSLVRADGVSWAK